MGLAGVVMGALALADVWRTPANVDGRRTLLFVAAILLSFSFVLAPLVRRAFARPTDFSWRGRGAHKTLLDEIRESGPLDIDASDAEESIAIAAVDTSASSIARLLILVYAIYGLTLACVLWALR
jgi:hypothetical protein